MTRSFHEHTDMWPYTASKHIHYIYEMEKKYYKLFRCDEIIKPVQFCPTHYNNKRQEGYDGPKVVDLNLLTKLIQFPNPGPDSKVF